MTADEAEAIMNAMSKIDAYGSDRWSCRFVVDSFTDLKTLPGGSFDVTITDPPFSAHVHANLCSDRAIDDGDEVRFEGYLVHVRCRTLYADELSARRVREDEESLAMLAEAVR